MLTLASCAIYRSLLFQSRPLGFWSNLRPVIRYDDRELNPSENAGFYRMNTIRRLPSEKILQFLLLRYVGTHRRVEDARKIAKPRIAVLFALSFGQRSDESDDSTISPVFCYGVN